jgi:hypothetical protein
MLLRYLVWLAVPLLALVELGAYQVHANRAPEPEEWKQLLPAAVAELRKENELIVAAPYWSEPNLRFALGDGLMPLRDVARPDERRYARAIEVGLGRERTPELRGWQVQQEKTVGPFHLRVLQNPEPATVLFDFVDRLGPQQVSASIKKGKDYEDCPWNPKARVTNGALDSGHATYPRQRFDCSAPEWNFVGVTVIEDEQYRPRQCIWAPPSDAGVTRIRFDDVPLGKVIRGHAALPYWIERWGKGGAITLEVEIGEQEVGEVQHEDGEGWKPFEISTERFAGQRAAVVFEVRGRKGGQRQFCFHAEAL